MRNTLRVPRSIVEVMTSQSLAEYPHEVCGLIGGTAGKGHELCQIRNIAPMPECQYLMDPAELVQTLERFEANGLDLVGIYHSHPLGPAHPSETDIAESYYPDVVYVIISLELPGVPDVTAWSINDGQAALVRLIIED